MSDFFKLTKSMRVSSQQGDLNETPRTYLGDVPVELRVVINNGSTDVLIDMPIKKDTLKSLTLLSVGGNISIKTNDDSDPQETIELTNGLALDWDEDSPHDIFIADDIDKMYVTNASGANAIFTIRGIADVHQNPE